jgi:hypothetical protein
LRPSEERAGSPGLWVAGGIKAETPLLGEGDEDGAAEEYNGGCRCIQSRDERSGGRSLLVAAGDREKEMGGFYAEGRFWLQLLEVDVGVALAGFWSWRQTREREGVLAIVIKPGTGVDPAKGPGPGFYGLT